MKLYRNWIINEGARAGENTNERRYVRTYSHTYVRDRPYIPSTTLLCEGIISVLRAKLGSNLVKYLHTDLTANNTIYDHTNVNGSCDSFSVVGSV